MTLDEYLQQNITSEYADQPNFIATVSGLLAPLLQAQLVLQSMIPLFDLDLPPTGAQLDIIGEWVGESRDIAVPIPGLFFTWDGPANLGWDFGSWSPPGAPTEITTLPDDAYLTLIKGKIAANQWDGTTEGAYKIWNALFPTITILIQDYQDMSYSMGIIGDMIDSLTLALITGGYIPLRPEGVLIRSYFSGPAPFFAWDTPNGALLAGWDTGNWAVETAPT